MDTLLHPVGPEPERTYWIRRGIVAAAVLLVLALLFWFLGALFGGGTEQTGAPAPQESSATAGGPSSSPSSATSGASTGGASSTPAASGSSSSSASPTTSTSASSGRTPATPSPSASPSSAKPSASPTPTGPVMCKPEDVVVNVSGAKTVKSGASTQLSVTFTSATACILDFSAVPFDLTITSGSDRIWSTEDCGASQVSGLLKLQPFKPWSHSWTWNTQRSAAECKSVDEYLRPGTYVATAELQGSQKRVQVMQLVG